jgi:dipeptidyl aminopeptidase/acylaminoacyl peptidase
MRRFCASALAASSFFVLGWGSALEGAESAYLKPPQVIVDILEAPPLPDALVSPSRDTLALLERVSMPSIAELAQPMLRLAGTRINPRTNGLHRLPGIEGLVLMKIADGSEVRVRVPAGSSLGSVRFSPDGTKLALTRTTESGIELWVAEVATGAARAVAGPILNGVWGDPCEWLPDSSGLLCRLVPPERGEPPAASTVPVGPRVQESSGKSAPVRTYQDLLSDSHDEALFDYYFASQLAILAVSSGSRNACGPPGLYEEVRLSPNGEYLLVARLKRPYSYLVPAESFPKEVEVWNRRGELVKRIADLPLAETVPINGVPTGPRRFAWKPTESATLTWVEALDEGDPRKKVPERDKVLSARAPFSEPVELARTEFRFSSLAWTERGVGLLSEYDRTTRWRRTWILEASAAPRKLWDLSAEDRYADPGQPVARPRGFGRSGFGPEDGLLITQSGDSIYLSGIGASPEGERPFVDRLHLKTLAVERLFHTSGASYETALSVLSDDGRTLLTRYETPSEPPNYAVRDTSTGTRRALSAYPDPAPALRGVQKKLITYARSDGVNLSATLYLPPSYKEGEPLPLLMWAYPREFTDPAAAGQVVGSPHRFLSVSGASHLLLLTQGYAILDNPTMPIVGKGETANDRYVEQLVASAQAAVDEVVRLGVADRGRLGIGGHSYGAFMTANLLAHSDLFQAGIARSGAYNRSLTPFGFQNEIRTFWEAPEVYARMSPFWYAHRIGEPILLIHGEADNNSGTFPIQSERLYMALKGHGATVRYVTLPHEAHGYAARESVLHTVAEMLNWCERYLKGSASRTPTSAAR